ncbi:MULTISPECIES: DUF5305 family protein [Acidiplasma]|jgi:hypothetical protein|uniref:DUF5305 domain-containing protein n=1 Tax=Acidiplasma cupricumulans TaxID=312540 RepID=A0A0Q0XJ64_9ARCH|nr:MULTISPECIES: DUF5305 family protein [Acidiplasma]KJE49380.1 hypothetical protein TZ01_04830 [Acidiplasma sp. MBA-1]KQB34906.1 hypothetical protein AOG55_08685 [Acidiplasma cupricumulans]WMT54678.1 MAG: DUF5305 family protein [Acidiplasma sp.]
MNKKLYITLIVIFALLIIFSSIIIMEPREHTKNINVTDFASNAKINVNDSLKNNSLYSVSTLYNPSVIYKNISKNMTVYVTGNFLASEAQSVLIQYTVYAVSSEPSWTRIFMQNSSSFTFSGSHEINDMVIPLNISGIYNKAASIDNELGYTSSMPAIDINLTIIDANTGTSSSTGIIINGANKEYTISYGKPASMTSDTDVKDSYGGKPVIPEPQLYGYIIMAASIASIVIISLSFLGFPKKRSEMDKNIDEYSDRIIEIKYMPRGTSIKVDSFSDLVKLSDAYHEPLFYIKEKNLFFVFHDFKNYVYGDNI